MIREGTVLWDYFRKVVSPTRFHYCALFGGPHNRTPDGRAVLLDLSRYCHANSPTTTEREIGRRDVWLRLQRFLNIDEEELVVLMAGLTPEQRQQHWAPGATYIE